jgi:hypothetical protein
MVTETHGTGEAAVNRHIINVPKVAEHEFPAAIAVQACTNSARPVPIGHLLTTPMCRVHLDGIYDFRVPGAAAKVAAQIVSDFIARRIGIVVDKRRSPHGDARDAESALNTTGPDETRRNLIARGLGQALGGRDLFPGNIRGPRHAREPGSTVNQYRTAAARSLGLATVLW